MPSHISLVAPLRPAWPSCRQNFVAELRMHEIDDALPGGLVRVVVHAGAAGRDARVRRDVGHLGEHQAGAADGARAVVHEVPVGRQAVDCAEYWHIGDTTTRLSKVMPRRRNGWNIGAGGFAVSTSKPSAAHVARHDLVDLVDELRRAQRQIVVGDRLRARHQAEREARRVHVPEALDVLEPDQRHVGGVLRLLDLVAPPRLEVRQRGGLTSRPPVARNAS